jgi:hypothetical protein
VLLFVLLTHREAVILEIISKLNEAIVDEGRIDRAINPRTQISPIVCVVRPAFFACLLLIIYLLAYLISNKLVAYKSIIFANSDIPVIT